MCSMQGVIMRVISCLLILVAGCGGVPTVGGSANRATSDEVFATCRDMGLVDSQIETLLIIARVDRDNGTTEEQGIRNSFLLCEDQSGIPEGSCLICTLRLMNFVYGE